MPAECLHVYKGSNAYLFEPVYTNKLDAVQPTVQISRPDGTIRINEPVDRQSFSNCQPFKAHAIVGVINLLAGPYILVCSERRLIGDILGHPVYHVEKVDIYPCALETLPSDLSAPQMSDEKQYLMLLQSFLQSGGVYYSPSYDLTSSLQSHHQADRFSSFLQLSQTINNMFVANRSLLGRLLGVVEKLPDSRLEDFVAICIYGFVQIKQCVDVGINIKLAVVSRRSTGRVGTRYHSRGIDDVGHVSNFVETEQIVIDTRKDRVASLLQSRGSIPLYWRQNINMRYSPSIELYNYDQNESVMKRHLAHMKDRYNTPIVVVNLIDQKGREALLGRALSMHLSDLNDPDINYVPWDFHQHCKHMQWQNVALLLDTLQPNLLKIGWFEVDQSGGLVKSQRGIVRTNCIDCLDRTNVVQSVIAKRMLLDVLSIWQGSTLIPASLDIIFKNVWADNADAISQQYSGTGALKTDYTRTGSRTRLGALNDLTNSLSRYMLNNFFDASRQDSMDLFFGHYQVTAHQQSPFSGAMLSGRSRLLIPVLIGIILAILSFQNRNYVPVYVAIYVGVLMMVRQYSGLFVQLPRLRPPPMAISRPTGSNIKHSTQQKEHII